MSNPIAYIAINPSALLGAEINATIAKAIAHAADGQKAARESTVRVQFDFNGVRVEVEADSDPSLIFRDWRRCIRGYIDGTVGPHPAKTLTKAQIAKDRRLEAEAEAKRQAADAEWRQREAAGKAARDAELAEAPPMARDQAAWDRGVAAQKGDGYGLAVYEFAEGWARLMQKRMAEGRALADIAEETSRLADHGIGVSGFMHGAAVSILGGTWEHGADLLRWRERPSDPTALPSLAGEA